MFNSVVELLRDLNDDLRMIGQFYLIQAPFTNDMAASTEDAAACAPGAPGRGGAFAPHVTVI